MELVGRRVLELVCTEMETGERPLVIWHLAIFHTSLTVASPRFHFPPLCGSFLHLHTLCFLIPLACQQLLLALSPLLSASPDADFQRQCLSPSAYFRLPVKNPKSRRCGGPLKKLNIELPYDPTVPRLGISVCARWIIRKLGLVARTLMFATALSVIAKR